MDESSPNHKENDMLQGTLFSRIEESRQLLEDELGLELFIKIYRYVQVCNMLSTFRIIQSLYLYAQSVDVLKKDFYDVAYLSFIFNMLNPHIFLVTQFSGSIQRFFFKYTNKSPISPRIFPPPIPHMFPLKSLAGKLPGTNNQELTNLFQNMFHQTI